MRAILSNQLERKLAFVELLFENEWMNLDEISEVIGAAESTLITDIKEINDFAAPIKIRTSTKHGIRLQIPPNYSMDYLYEKIVARSIEFNLLEKIFFKDYYTIRELADDSYSSISQIRFKINHLNEILPRFGFSIEANPLRLVGNETNLSLFFYRYFDLAYLTRPFPFPSEKIEKADRLLKAASKKPSMALVTGYRQLSIWLLIRQHRISQGYFIEETIEPGLPAYHETVTPAFWDLFDSNEYDRIYRDVYSQVLQLNVLLSLTTLEKVMATNAKVRNEFKAIENLVNKLEEKLQTKVPKKQVLILELYNMININIHTNFSILIHDSKKYERRFTQNFYPFFRLTFQQELDAIGLTDDNQSNKLLTIEILYTIIERRPQLFEYMFATLPNIKLAVLSSSMISTFAENFAERFGMFYDVVNLSLEDIPSLAENQAGYEILVTNVNGLEIKNGVTVCVTSFMTPRDYHNIDLAYEKILTQKLMAYNEKMRQT